MTKEEAIANLKTIMLAYIEPPPTKEQIKIINDTFDMAIEALKEEPFINKPCVSTEACKYDKNKVLDKIRTEIEQKARPNELGGRGNGKSIRYGLCMALEIIDKYKAESEDKHESI